MTSVPAATTDLRRELGLLDATMINVGTMIASAIFIVPATVAALIPGSGAMVLVWVLGGLVSLLGALSIAELSAAYPEAGGQLPYLRAAYGPLWGFLYGWANFLVRSEEHTSELQSPCNLVCRLLLEKKKENNDKQIITSNYITQSTQT